MEPDCEFCRIVQGTNPARIVADDADVLAFFPLRPVARGHTLVVPKLHIPDLRVRALGPSPSSSHRCRSGRRIGDEDQVSRRGIKSAITP
jgi:hypothetical protein